MSTQIAFNSPRASVIMPVYNAEKYIDIAIESVLNQSFTDFELLLINDGSTDRSLERLEHYEKLDKRCKVITTKNQGIVATCNLGVELASAEIIFRMDADDICLPLRFETQIKYLDENPNCVVVGCAVMLIDSDGCPITKSGELTSHEAIDAANMSGSGSHLYHPTFAMRKSKVVEVGSYRELYKHAEDLDLLLRLAEVGQIINLEEILVHYRQHPASIGYAKRAEQVKSTQLAVLDAFKRRNIEPTKNVLEMNASAESPSLFEIHTKWAWWALMGGHASTARKHALKAFLCKPFSLENLKLYAVVIRGY